MNTNVKAETVLNQWQQMYSSQAAELALVRAQNAELVAQVAELTQQLEAAKKDGESNEATTTQPNEPAAQG